MQPVDVSEPETRVLAECSEQESASDISTIYSLPRKRVKRIYDKKHCCFFCNKFYAKMARHLEQCHKNESEVASILCLSKKSKSRKAKFLHIMKKGDFCHNKEVHVTKQGSLIPRKRTTNMTNNSHLPCPHCFGLYNKKDLWRHVRKCKANFGDEKIEDVQVAGRMLLPVSKDITSEFHASVLNTMVMDEVFEVIMKDQLVLSYGEREFQKCKSQPHQFNNVKQKMREFC